MDSLPIEDVRAIVRMLGEVAELTCDLPGKRRFLLEGLAKLIGADVWFWVHFRDHPLEKSQMSFMIVDGDGKAKSSG